MGYQPPNSFKKKEKDEPVKEVKRTSNVQYNTEEKKYAIEVSANINKTGLVKDVMQDALAILEFVFSDWE